jgi:hypothetical protein
MCKRSSGSPRGVEWSDAGEGVPTSRRAAARRGGGRCCRGQPRGSPKTTRGILLKTCKKPKLNTSHLSTHTGHDPHYGVPTAHQSGPLKGPLERVPPRSRVHTSLEQVPPRSRVHGPLERAPPRSRVHLRLARGFCTRTSIPARGYGHLMLW